MLAVVLWLLLGVPIIFLVVFGTLNLVLGQVLKVLQFLDSTENVTETIDHNSED